MMLQIIHYKKENPQPVKVAGEIHESFDFRSGSLYRVGVPPLDSPYCQR